jgi:urease subunit gamma/beta
MTFGPGDEDRLRIFAAAELARRTLERGLRLNAPEAIALICDEMHLAARAGASFEDVLQAGRSAVRRDQVLDGVDALAAEIRIEVLLDEGSRLIVLRDPLGAPSTGAPGAVVVGAGDVELAPARSRVPMRVTNGSDRPVRVSSHYPFWRANPRLRFDRDAARGYRLDVPAGSSIRWAPGETIDVSLVALAGSAE